jgi:hypothetical protein
VRVTIAAVGFPQASVCSWLFCSTRRSREPHGRRINLPAARPVNARFPRIITRKLPPHLRITWIADMTGKE